MRLGRAEYSEVGKAHDRGKVSTEARSPERQLIPGMSDRISMSNLPVGQSTQGVPGNGHGRCGSECNRGTGGGKTARPGLRWGCWVTGAPTAEDVVGQINILSAYTTGKPGKLPAPALGKHHMPHNLRLMRRRRDSGQVLSICSLENSHG